MRHADRANESRLSASAPADLPKRQFAISATVCRIAIAVAVLLAMRTYVVDDYAKLLSSGAPGGYQPKGIIALLWPDVPPSAAVLHALVPVGIVATLAALVGFVTPVAWALSAFSSLTLTGILWSFTPAASHGYNVLLLAQIVAIFLPAAPRWSIDGRLGWFSSRTPFRERWRLFLLQATAASMYLGAVLSKLRADDGFGFGWATADNLRKHLIRRYPQLGEEFPAHVAWIVDREWVCALLAAGNLFTQISPAIACLLFRWPRLRLLFGVSFVVEILALGLLMGLWDIHLLPLALLFVDFDHFFGRYFGPREADSAMAHDPGLWPRLSLGAMTVVVAVIVLAAIHPDPQLETRRNIYPLANYPMYSTVFPRAELEIAAVEFDIKSWPSDPKTFDFQARSFQRSLNDAVIWSDSRAVAQQLMYVGEAMKPYGAARVAIDRVTYRFPNFPAAYERREIAREHLGAWTPEGIQVPGH